MTKLTHNELSTMLAAYPEWRLENDSLVRDLVFEDFAQAIVFVNRVAVMAEESHHHPDIVIRYNKVQLTIASHDVGGITTRDAKMAAKVQQMRPLGKM